ncbi:MAG: UDP-N-acetylglucosamine--N-acetylmuramyl-(pentapeptide) pyrophosphoryl-undecaprenol N-acetylglucosamine transferase [Candidatus Marinimicrobia bacterium]|nr:UDP-N-acetylglucosamine--N-acetylmuramyl-(pentapeptide) pyrophosphoryl-undecaprenol N-acetylglucosamine transferase [Candidatus Neomarinimicrobiota bacterium]MBL7046104.1 UDP-N-acetylglucosamine--N-acetylmuramyl-(pentapeptide) pyrophosphoryl-undecaprenol N-acetylglucosamine transferase [Candidatus Neomarinimicrobiota bacterium]
MNRSKALSKFQLDPDHPIITIIGGSQGSLFINSMVSESLDYLAGKLNIQFIWQTGPTHFDDLQHFESKYSSISLHPFIDHMDSAYAAADLVISRAGAIALSEIAYCGKPSLLIPFHGAAADHQTKNARSLEKAGAAIVLSENKLTKERFIHEVEQLLSDREKLVEMENAARSVSTPDAANTIVDNILELVYQ